MCPRLSKHKTIPVPIFELNSGLVFKSSRMDLYIGEPKNILTSSSCEKRLKAFARANEVRDECDRVHNASGGCVSNTA